MRGGGQGGERQTHSIAGRGRRGIYYLQVFFEHLRALWNPVQRKASENEPCSQGCEHIYNLENKGEGKRWGGVSLIRDQC